MLDDKFSEKSFEIRFCAALSAALMPFNRNPLWFGLTQKQEKKYCFDTTLYMGGQLFLFQFKANKGDGKIFLNHKQWKTLCHVEGVFPKSTFYVFPKFSSLEKAHSAGCLLKYSWLSGVASLAPAFVPRDAKKSCIATPTITLNSLEEEIEFSSRPEGTPDSISIMSTCDFFGCACSPITPLLNSLMEMHRISRFSRFSELNQYSFFALNEFGITILNEDQREQYLNQDDHQSSEERHPIMYSEDWRKLFKEFAENDSSHGLIGLFLPH